MIIKIRKVLYCLIQEKELILDNTDEHKYILEIWDISNTQKTIKFNRFPITRKFYSANDAQILIFFIEPRKQNSLDMTKMLFDISRTKCDKNAVFVLCLTKNDLIYTEEEITEIKLFAKDNSMELIYSSSFSENFGLEDEVFRKLIIKYNENN